MSILARVATGSRRPRVAIIGCGRLGGHLAEHLSRQGHDVVAVDVDARATTALPVAFGGFRIVGDATQVSVLREARVDQADVVFVTTRDDNVNLMVAQVARHVLGVPRVVARVFDPARGHLYHGLDIETVCPTLLAAAACCELMMAGDGRPAPQARRS